MPRRNSIASSTTSDDYASCLGACCHCIGCFLCLTQIRTSHRVALTWFWMIVLAVVGGAIVAKVYFTSVNVVLHPTDMRVIDMKSTSMCADVDITSYAPIEAYITESEPDVLVHGKKDVYSFKASKYLQSRRYEYWDFYLLEGSDVEIQICTLQNSDQDNYVVVIKGEDNFNDWTGDTGCCYEKRFKIKSCTTGDIPTFYYNSKDTDRYYFAVYTYARSGVQFHLNFQLARTLYDMTDATLECEQEKHCTIPMDSRYLIVYYPVDQESKASTSGTITAECNPQYYVFAAIFVFLPIGIALAITGIIVARSRRNVSRSRRNSDIFVISSNVRGATAGSGIVSTAFVLEPPPYSECCGAPPSYDEVLRLKGQEEEC